MPARLLGLVLAASSCTEQPRPPSPYEAIYAQPMDDWHQLLVQIPEPETRYAAYKHGVATRLPPPISLASSLAKDGHLILRILTRDVDEGSDVGKLAALHAIASVQSEHLDEVCRSEAVKRTLTKIGLGETGLAEDGALVEIMTGCDWLF